MIFGFRAAVFAAGLAMTPYCAASKTIVDKPVTTSIPVSNAVRSARVVLLHLDQVSTPKDAQIVLNIFLELPSASSATSVDHPNFVGYITSLPNSSAPKNPTKGFVLQLPETATRALRKLTTAQITFVPEQALSGGAVTIGAIRLEPVQP